MDTARATYSPWFRAGHFAAFAVLATVACHFLCGARVTIEDVVKGAWLALCAAIVLLRILASFRWIEIDDATLRTKRWLTGGITEYPVSDIRTVLLMGMRKSTPRSDDGPRAAAVRVRFSTRRSLLILGITHRGFDAFVRGTLDCTHPDCTHGDQTTRKP